MKNAWAGFGFLAALAATPLAAEEVYFKSPGPGMRFTAGLPVVVWSDVLPRDEQAGFPRVECYWDDPSSPPPRPTSWAPTTTSRSRCPLPPCRRRASTP